MSASREKKQRLKEEGLTEKQRQQARDARKARTRSVLYTVIGSVVTVLIAALLIWNSGFFQMRATAVTVGDEKYTVSDLSYYYYSLANSTASQARSYAQYGIDMGYNPDLSPEEQTYSEGKTFADYFRQTAVDNLQQTVLLCGEAQKAGYTLSDEGQASVDDVLSQLKTNAATSGYSEAAYLKLLYGSYMTMDVFKKQITMSTLAGEYQTYYTGSLSYTDDQLEACYGENAAMLDTYDYRYCFISGTAEPTTDASGSTVDPTDEENAAAMDTAKAKADEMVSRYKAGGDFNTLAAEYVSESSAASYSDPEYNHQTDKLGNELSSYPYADWLMDGARKADDMGAVESSGSGYYVVLLLNRQRLEDSYQTADVRHILVLAKTEGASNGSDQEALPTEAQLAEAKARAESLLSEWKSGAATSDSFAQLANLNSDDPGSNTNGGLYQNVERGKMIASFNDWIFTPGRKAGDTGIVVNTNGSTDDVLGYHVMYLEKLGEVRWKYQARSMLSSDDYNTWYDGVKENYPVTTNAGGLALVK